DNDQSYDPVRNAEHREDLRDSLGKRPASDDVSESNLVNVATLQFTEESLRIHRFALLPQRQRKSKRLPGSARFRECSLGGDLSDCVGRWSGYVERPALSTDGGPQT